MILLLLQLVHSLKEDNAPFAEPGEDCFADVDHIKTTKRVKTLTKLALDYLKHRMRESLEVEQDLKELKTKFASDLLIAQLTETLNDVHRGVVRNWHHIQLLLRNLAPRSDDY